MALWTGQQMAKRRSVRQHRHLPWVAESDIGEALFIFSAAGDKGSSIIDILRQKKEANKFILQVACQRWPTFRDYTIIFIFRDGHQVAGRESGYLRR
jgi:hypothetical protein